MFGVRQQQYPLFIRVMSDDINPPYACHPHPTVYMVKTKEEAQYEADRINRFYEDNNFINPPNIEIFEFTEDEVFETLVSALKYKR